MHSTHNPIVVEPLRAGDVVAFAHCAALDATIFPGGSIPPLDRRGGPPAMWVARGGRGGVAGFVVVVPRRSWAHIVGLAVTPPARRRGVARALLRAAIAGARARGCPGVVLEVSTANHAAIALYAAEGFERVRRLARYYRDRQLGDGGDAWGMVLRLDPGGPAAR
jgi:ribosomal protein S18 acetylase RimI-like enzyme